MKRIVQGKQLGHFFRRLAISLAALVFVSLVFGVTTGVAVAEGPKRLAPELVSCERIWDRAPHNAFTDLVRWRDKFYCAFREGEGHAGDVGKLRVVESVDGSQWQSVVALEMDDFDMRDAALCVTPDDRLMVLGGAQKSFDGQRATGTFVSFSSDGRSFTAPKLVIPPGRWLWRVTWHGSQAYGVSYAASQGRPFSALLSTKDGEQYSAVTDKLLGEGWPTEARVRFTDNGTCLCLHRRDGSEGNTAYLGRSEPPYTDWQWKDTGVRFGGPNFLQLPGGQWVGVGRLYDGQQRTSIVQLDVEQGTIDELLRLPSGGDTSYPGLVWHDELLWVSYYASHEGKTNIYLAKLRFPGQSQEREQERE
jgi:hypothetical protein